MLLYSAISYISWNDSSSFSKSYHVLWSIWSERILSVGGPGHICVWFPAESMKWSEALEMWCLSEHAIISFIPEKLWHSEESTGALQAIRNKDCLVTKNNVPIYSDTINPAKDSFVFTFFITFISLYKVFLPEDINLIWAVAINIF